MRGLVLVGLCSLAAGKKGGGSDSCPDAYLWKGSGVVPLCEAHFPDDKAKNGWIVYFQGEDNWAQKLVQESRSKFMDASKAAKKDESLAGLKFGAVSCYGASQPFCAKRGARKYPAIVYTDGKTVESFPHTPEQLRTLDQAALLAFARSAAAGGAGKSTQCAQGVFAKDSDDAVLPLCDAFFPSTGTWVVAFYDKASAHEDKKLRVVMNKAAKKFGNLARAKQAKKVVPVRVGAVKCADSPDLCAAQNVEAPVGEPIVRVYRHGALVAESAFGDFTDGEELRDWARAAAPEEDAGAPADSADSGTDAAGSEEAGRASEVPQRAFLETELARVREEKAAAVEAEDFKLAKKLKAEAEQLEAQLATVQDGAAVPKSKADLEAELAQVQTEKAAAVAAEDFRLAKKLKSKAEQLEVQLKAHAEL